MVNVLLYQELKSVWNFVTFCDILLYFKMSQCLALKLCDNSISYVYDIECLVISYVYDIECLVYFIRIWYWVSSVMYLIQYLLFGMPQSKEPLYIPKRALNIPKRALSTVLHSISLVWHASVKRAPIHPQKSPKYPQKSPIKCTSFNISCLACLSQKSPYTSPKEP